MRGAKELKEDEELCLCAGLWWLCEVKVVVVVGMVVSWNYGSGVMRL